MEIQQVVLDEADCRTNPRFLRHNGPHLSQHAGTGMPTIFLAKAFAPFFQPNTWPDGHGLGLIQVSGFIKQSGGH